MSRAAPKRLLLAALCAAFALLFVGLGTWQLQRLQWKLDLIQRVEARISAKPVPVPRRDTWSRLDARELEYRRVFAFGKLDRSKTTLVDALTERGPGHWVLTPLMTEDGPLLVNEGFVPKGWQPPSTPIGQAEARVTGLIRLSEPGGRILRPNQPDADRWFSRDVEAIAARHPLRRVAPFFIDADRKLGQASYPIGGMTVVKFRNAHLIYALTWFGLSIVSFVGLVLVLRSPTLVR